jgi:serine O-acetyltransferase
MKPLSIIKDDLFRYTGSRSNISLLKAYPPYIFYYLRLRHYTFKYGIDIGIGTRIGNGFYIGHFGGIIVSSAVVIGKNVNISQGVTIGVANRGNRQGGAIIGDNVYIAPGVKIVGKVIIGNNVAIGAGAIVTKDIPDNSVVVGNPGRVISDKGAEDYVNRRI